MRYLDLGVLKSQKLEEGLPTFSCRASMEQKLIRQTENKQIPTILPIPWKLHLLHKLSLPQNKKLSLKKC